MVVRKSYLRRRAEGGPGSRVGDEPPRRRDATLLGTIAGVLGLHSSERKPGELDDLPLPDLLTPSESHGPDTGALLNLLELAFLGRASAGELDDQLDSMTIGPATWVAEHFTEDLFLAELVNRNLIVTIGGTTYAAHKGFLLRALATPPTDTKTIRFRQMILRELEEREDLRRSMERLLTLIFRFLTLLRASRDDARLEPTRFRFDVLRAFRSVVDLMADGFGTARSGLQRLESSGRAIRESGPFLRMVALLDHHDAMASLDLAATIGADGRLRHLEIRGLREQRKNIFFQRPLRRWIDRFRIFYHRYNIRGGELAERLVMGVFQEVAPAMARVVQLVCHLELYAASRSFADQARSRGLEVCLPDIAPEQPLDVDRLFNPLLLNLTDQPIPTDLRMHSTSPITLITGPNSGGKTRLLQAVGIAQVLGQSGLYAPCADARLPLVEGLFASIIEFDRADQSEGRLGTEMMRLRVLFETVPTGSLVLLDELCSGTNPSEAIEIVDVVLHLLRQVEPVAFVTTHFLDFADQLQNAPTVSDLGFLQAEVDGNRGATYRFIPGVATTSLAVGTARRLGVTFDQLERELERRNSGTAVSSGSQQVHDLPDGDHQK